MSLGLLTSGLLVFVATLVLVKIVTCRLALIKFKKLSRGLPILPEAKLLGNHAHSVFFGDRVCQKLQEWHREIGPTIGFLRGTEFCVSTVDLDLIKTFIVEEPQKHLNRTSMGLPTKEVEDSIFVKPETEWRPLRRAFAPALVPKKFRMPNVQQEIESSIEKLVGLIDFKLKSGQPASNVFVADDILARYSGDLIFRCFYKQGDLVDFKAEHDESVHEHEVALATLRSSWFVYLVTIFPRFRRIVEWLAIKCTSVGRIQMKYRHFVEEQIRLGLAARRQWPELKREAEKKGIPIDPQEFVLRDGTRYRRNMADHIIDQFIDGRLTKEELVNNSAFFMVAGFRTAADCLIHTLYLLSINQNVQDKLRTSIVADGADSEYLDWMLKESLRLLPPGTIGCSRTISRDIELASGHVVPRGTFVHTNAYVIHRLKEYWGEDAHEFRPERWRDTSHHHPMQFLAFGSGPRCCPGRQFAMHEMKMLLAALLTRYKFKGEPRDDAYEFDAPIFSFIIPNSPTCITIRLVNAQ